MKKNLIIDLFLSIGMLLAGTANTVLCLTSRGDLPIAAIVILFIVMVAFYGCLVARIIKRNKNNRAK